MTLHVVSGDHTQESMKQALPPPKHKQAPSQQASKPKVQRPQTQDDMITPMDKMPTQSGKRARWVFLC